MKTLILALCLVFVGCSDGIDLNELSTPCGDHIPEFVTPDCECDDFPPCPPKKHCLFIDGKLVVVDSVNALYEYPTNMGYDPLVK